MNIIFNFNFKKEKEKRKKPHVTLVPMCLYLVNPQTYRISCAYAHMPYARPICACAFNFSHIPMQPCLYHPSMHGCILMLVFPSPPTVLSGY